MKTFRIVTLGCKVNQYESAWLRESLLALNWEWRDRGPVDVTVVNSCIVTGSASRQSRQEIRKAIRRSPGNLVAATGCHAQVFPEELSGIDGVGLVVGNSLKGGMARILEKAVNAGAHGVFSGDFDPQARFDPMPLSCYPGRSRAILKIQDGCESFCSFCIVPFARGPSRCLAPSDVLRAIESYCFRGHREIVLTGIHLGLYGSEGNRGGGLASLLRKIRGEKFPARVRLSSLEPNEVTAEIIDLVAEGGWICRHLHIPLQSGDDGILAAMNRHYTSEDFAGVIRRVREACPRACIGVDLMCGFPGEDNRAFENTRALISDLPVSYLHVFPFSPRPGTGAAALPGRVGVRDTKARTEVMRTLGLEKRAAFFAESVGQVHEVLREEWKDGPGGIATGTSDNYLPMRFRCRGGNPAALLAVLARRIAGDCVEGVITSGQATAPFLS